MSLVLQVMGSIGRGSQQRDTKADAGKERLKDETGKRKLGEIDNLGAGLTISSLVISLFAASCFT